MNKKFFFKLKLKKILYNNQNSFSWAKYSGLQIPSSNDIIVDFKVMKL